ncbi:hypothetical protein L2E82_36366 [Cichorium intybus]|uniref:Uncharacterized protein n=1 Tax=Cichorium intybus TaxID=13427 RepID=A0ACB9BRJ3_CICIN|nr:hypothetical protein L2E82_36366 [Cichorium intybus]
MRVFAPGGSTAPKLKYIHTSLGKHDVDQHGLNFHVTATAHYQTPFPSSFPATSEGLPWSFHNLIELDVEYQTRDIQMRLTSNSKQIIKMCSS